MRALSTKVATLDMGGLVGVAWEYFDQFGERRRSSLVLSPEQAVALLGQLAETLDYEPAGRLDDFERMGR